MTLARCACGALALTLAAPPRLTALCHCLACQRRTGAPFSANAFYPAGAVEVTGASKVFVRTADSGRAVRMHFCETCGSIVFWRADASPDMIGVAVGSFADPAFPPPTLSVFEQARHDWVMLGETIGHHQGLP